MPTTSITTINPATGKILERYPLHTIAQAQERLASAAAAQERWRTTSLTERAQALLRIGEILLRDRQALAELMKAEMGKAIKEGLAEVEKCAACARYYAEKGPAFLADLEVPTEAHKSFVAFEPLGLVLAIMPWNFPFWQAFRCVIPALLAGNAVALKHASNVSGCALAAENVITEALPEKNLFTVLLMPGKSAIDLIALPQVSAVSFTGSTEVGKSIAATAGAHLKKCVLELGGSDAYVVLADANIEKAASACFTSRMINGGQSCIAAKRFVVEEKALAKFTRLFTERMQAAEAPPLAREDLRADLHGQVERSIALGAKLLTGGRLPEGEGYFYPPTVLVGVKPGMPAFDEETFGPVAAIISAANEEEALRLANLSPFGLGSAVFTGDLKKGSEIARRHLQAGSAFVNNFVRSDPRLPFGGVKQSGYGRELSSFGIHEFVNIKTIYVDA